MHARTHAHNHYTALWTLSGTTWVSWYQKVHFATFWMFWCKMKITQADTSTIRMDCHPSRLIGAPISVIPTIFMSDALPGTTLPIYPDLGQAPNMLACNNMYIENNVGQNTRKRLNYHPQYLHF